MLITQEQNIKREKQYYYLDYETYLYELSLFFFYIQCWFNITIITTVLFILLPWPFYVRPNNTLYKFYDTNILRQFSLYTI